MLMSAGAIALMVLSAVSVRILREPRGPAGLQASGPIPVAATAPRFPGSAQPFHGNQAGSQTPVLTAALTGADPSTLATSPDLIGPDAGVTPGSNSTGGTVGSGP